MDDDLMPKGFYNQPRQANLPANPRAPRTNLPPANADPHLPENFFKHRPTATNLSAHEQLGIQPTANPNPQSSRPGDFDTFDIERRLKLLSSNDKKTVKPVKTSDLQARLAKLKGEDKPPPTILDIETRLKNLSGATAKDLDDDSATGLSNSPKRRKQAPLITVMAITQDTNPEDLVKQVQSELGLVDPKTATSQKIPTTSPQKPVAEMSPEELLAFVKNERFDLSDSESSSDDLISSDGTHDSISSDLITDDEDSMTRKQFKNNCALVKTNSVSRKEWKKVVREVLAEDQK